jgi:APA family basic amino acid/polyamine antiporter
MDDPPSLRQRLLRTKSVDEIKACCAGEHALKKVIGPLELVFFGVGAIIGTGIFVITGVAAGNFAGPGLVISFMISGVACLFAALCYAEFATMVPVAGSAYTYGYASLGEIWAWIIGWDLILEYSVAIAVVAVGWSGYMSSFLSEIGLNLPAALVNPPGVAGGIINLPAILIIALITVLLISGVKGSARVNTLIVVAKIAVVIFFIALGVFYVNPDNWNPFLPFGWSGVITGAAIVFFAYIGFDAVSTAAEEVKNPSRDLPVGILGSLIICTILYIAVAAVLTGIVPYSLLSSTPAPVAYAMEYVGIPLGAEIISVGAVLGITSVMLVLLYGQSRIFFAMARDGLLPRSFAKVHPTLRTPVRASLLVGAVTAVMASLLPLESMAELVNIGTLAAFVIVSLGIIVLRRTRPEIPRPFRCPLVPLVPALAIGFCLALIFALPTITHLRFVIWLAIGLVIYSFYGYGHARYKNPGLPGGEESGADNE